MRQYVLNFVLMLCLSCHLFAQGSEPGADDKKEKDKKEEKPIKAGNLALPSSQQPNALISFGQNILNKGQAQLLLFADDLHGRDQEFVNVVPSLLYGITDTFSIFLSAPIAHYEQNGQHSSGIEDLSAQFEYAFYTKEDYTYSDEATVVTNVSFPTGSTRKNPPTGFGAASFFIGGTYARTGIEWYYFTSHGATLTSSHHGTKFGNQFLYQGGVGRNIANVEDWLFVWMIELDGQYSCKDRIQGVTNPDSGGNVIYLTPSLWVSSEKFLLQLGAGYAIQQHLFGDQNRNDYLLALNTGWTF